MNRLLFSRQFHAFESGPRTPIYKTVTKNIPAIKFNFESTIKPTLSFQSMNYLESPNYKVQRVQSTRELPVFLEVSNGGTKITTLIRSVMGDIKVSPYFKLNLIVQIRSFRRILKVLFPRTALKSNIIVVKSYYRVTGWSQ